MYEHMSSEQEAREAADRARVSGILRSRFHSEKKEPYHEGRAASHYAARVFDDKEMCDSDGQRMLDFWLTTGRFSDEFEKEFAEWLGVKYCASGQQRFVGESDRLYGADRAGTGRAADCAAATRLSRLRAAFPPR